MKRRTAMIDDKQRAGERSSSQVTTRKRVASLALLVLLVACGSADDADEEPAAIASGGSAGSATGGTSSGGTSGGRTSSGGTSSGGTSSGGAPSAGATSGGASSGGQTNSGGNGATSGQSSGAAGMPAAPSSFSIGFEYAYDTVAHFDEPKRKLLTHAGESWARYIESEFSDIPAGTALRARHPEHIDMEGMVFDLDYAIDDVVILMGSSLIDGAGSTLASSSSSFTNQVTDATLLETLRTRYEGNPFEPWMAQTTFDTEEVWAYDATPETDDDLPAADNDFVSTAIHEIGHVLGIGSAAAFEALVEDGNFVGPKAIEVHGGPVPLAPDESHFARDISSRGKVPSMELGTAPGQRKRPTALDLAVLEDLGYSIRWELVE
jgi:hypothetical protein